MPSHVDAGVHRIGLLTSKSGPGAVFSVASEYMAELAVEEINADGGLDGRPVELVVGDDETNADQAAREARRLIAAGCRSIVASVTSASFGSAVDALSGTGRPVIHSLLNEGGAGAGDVLRWGGERPFDQVRAAASTVMNSAAGKRVHDRQRLPLGARCPSRWRAGTGGGGCHDRGGEPVRAARYRGLRVHLGGHRAERCGLCALDSGGSGRGRLRAADVGPGLPVPLADAVVGDGGVRAGEDRRSGITGGSGRPWATSKHSTPPRTSSSWAATAVGTASWPPPLSSLSESVYEAIVLYASAVRQSRGGDESTVTNMLRRSRGRMPRGGAVRSEGPHRMRQDLYVARAESGGFRIQNG